MPLYYPNPLPIVNGGTGQSTKTTGFDALSPMTTQGDVIYGGASGTATRLAKGTQYQTLQAGSSIPGYDAVHLSESAAVTGTLPVGNGGTGSSTTFTAGSVVFAGASGVYSQNNTKLFWDNSNNRLGVGTGSPGVFFDVLFSSNTGQGVNFRDSANNNGQTFVGFFTGTSTQIGGITGNGSNTTSYNTTSDYRLKDSVAPISGALDDIMKLNPVSYIWKNDGRSGRGFIAHEVQSIVPEAVTGNKDEKNPDGSDLHQMIDYSKLVPLLVSAIQVLKKELDDIKLTIK